MGSSRARSSALVALVISTCLDPAARAPAVAAFRFFPVAEAADAPGEADRTRARSLFQEGSADFKAGRWVMAEAKFREAHDLTHAPLLLFNIALCLERQEKWRAAADMYEVYREKVKEPKERRALEQQISDLKAKARQKEEKEARAALAAARSAATPAPVLSPVASEPIPSQVVAAPVPAETEQRPFWKKWWFWTAVVGGGAAVGAGVGLGLGLGLEQPSAAPTTLGDHGPGASSMGALGALP